jgi:hypothetical protein
MIFAGFGGEMFLNSEREGVLLALPPQSGQLASPQRSRWTVKI